MKSKGMPSAANVRRRLEEKLYQHRYSFMKFDLRRIKNTPLPKRMNAATENLAFGSHNPSKQRSLTNCTKRWTELYTELYQIGKGVK